MRLKREEVTMLDHASISKIAQAMANPIRTNLDYRGVARRPISVKRMYESIIGKTFTDAGGTSITITRRMQGKPGGRYWYTTPMNNNAGHIGTISYYKLRKKFRSI